MRAPDEQGEVLQVLQRRERQQSRGKAGTAYPSLVFPSRTHFLANELLSLLPSLPHTCTRCPCGLTAAQGGFTHGFVCEFQNAEDRDYYVNKDPVHVEFANSLAGVVKDARVLDYEPGKF